MKSFKQGALVTALSLTCSASFAEGFNFYALLDGGVASTSIKGGTTPAKMTEFVTGGYAPNFFGLTSEKTLGAGYSGGFKLEQGFLLNAPATGNSRFAFGSDALFNRQANLYIKGSTGTVAFGTQPNIAFNSVLFSDPRSAPDYGSSLSAIVIDGGLGTIDSNSASYTSPEIVGTKFAAQYVLGTSTTSNNGTGQRYSMTYKPKDFGLTAAYYSNASTTTPTSGTVLGATYQMGAVSLKALSTVQRASSTLKSLKTTGIGGSYMLSRETTLDIGSYKTKDTGYSMGTTAAGVQFKFLKDLTIYGQYALVKNSGTASTAFNFAPPTVLTGTLTSGQTANTLNIGLQYGFF